MEAERVYVFRIGHLGDTLAALPAFNLIAERHRGTPIDLITNRPLAAHHVGAAGVLTHTGRLGEVFDYEPRSLAAGIALARRLRRRGRGIVYNLSPAPGLRRALRDRLYFGALCGLGMRGLGFRVALQAMDVRRRGAGKSAERESDRLIAIARAAGCTNPAPALPLLDIPPQARSAALRAVSRLADDRQPIAVGAGSKMPAKRWPLDRYAKVMLDIAAADPAQGFVLLGDAVERSMMAALESLLPGRVLNLCGELSVIESAALLKECRLYLGNDTGTMHLAAAMGVPCVAVFSARDIPGRWYPMGSGHRILQTQPACRNCRLETCVEERMRCLMDIDAARVADSVRQVLAAAPIRNGLQKA